jgi:hypothetical protein
MRATGAWALMLATLGLALGEDEGQAPFGKGMLPTFMLAPGYVNLNHGSFGATPKPVFEAQRRWLEVAEQRPDVWFRQEYYLAIDAVSVTGGTCGAYVLSVRVNDLQKCGWWVIQIR